MRNQRSLLGHLTVTQAVSLGLIVIVVVTIFIARLLPHSSGGALVHDGPGPVAVATGSTAPGGVATSATAPPSGPLLHSPVAPVTKSGSPKPQTVAKSFGLAWLHHDGVDAAAWLHAVRPFTTPALATQLAQTDPANVPASQLAGAVTIVDDAADACGARVPTDRGTLVLTMQRVQDTWLVAAVDWNAA